MSIHTSLCDLFGIEHAALLAPVAGVSGGTLAAAISRACGLGLIGCGSGDADRLAREFDAAGNARIGVGFMRRSPLLAIRGHQHGRTQNFHYDDGSPDLAGGVLPLLSLEMIAHLGSFSPEAKDE